MNTQKADAVLGFNHALVRDQALGIGRAPEHNRIDTQLSLTYGEIPASERREPANHPHSARC